MSLGRIDAASAIAGLEQFSAIIDARSESEFAEDALPGAVNWPTLNDAERHEIGTIYKQVHPFEARKRGAALAARNIASHIERHVLDLPRDWSPLVYCWRGGQRSGSLSLVLAQIGFRVQVLEGGYKAFRAQVMQETVDLAVRSRWRVLCGPTGVGKTRVLHTLAALGEQVLDLEALAEHRSSVLGAVPGCPQPAQKRFETRLWQALRTLDPARPVFVESESRRIGRLNVPGELMQALRDSPCVRIEMPQPERVRLLLADYPHFAADTAAFAQRLQTLREHCGNATVQGWAEALGRGEVADVVQGLLERHYDPLYRRSMAGSFQGYAAAPVWELGRAGDTNDPDLLRSLVAQLDAGPG